MCGLRRLGRDQSPPPVVLGAGEVCTRIRMGQRGENRYAAATLEGFIQQLAVAYVKNGYYFYVTGRVPDGKDPVAIDRKLIDRYGAGISKWARARRKRAGLANIQYLRFERF